MKRAGFILAAGIAALVCLSGLSGCGFQEGAGATVTVVRETPTPTPTPTPEATPTPLPTPTPVIETEATASGVIVTKTPGTYVSTTDINLRADASADAAFVFGVPGGTTLTGTGTCDNGWVQISYEGQTVYASGDFLTLQAGSEPVEEAPAAQEAAEPVQEVVDNVVVQG